MQQFQAKWGTFAPKVSDRLLIGLRRYHLVRGKCRRRLDRHLSAKYPALDVTSGGIRYRCRVGDNATETGIIYRGERQEYWPWRQIRKHLTEGDTFVDIGANCGVYSLRASRIVGHSGRVVAIEPNPEMADRLRFNVNANQLRNVTVIQSAVGLENAKIPLYINSAQLGMCSTIGSGHNIEVEGRTLLDIVETCSLDGIHALKIDVEGAEDRALIPFLDSAPTHLLPTLIVTETTSAQTWARDLAGRLLRIGYRKVWEGNSDAAFLLQKTG